MTDNISILSHKEAVSLNLKKYFTGKPCPKGHIGEHYVKNMACVPCAMADNVRNKELKKIWDKNKYSKEKDYFRNKTKKWRDNNIKNKKTMAGKIKKIKLSPEELKQKKLLRQRKWAEKNKEKIRKADRAWKKRNIAYNTAQSAKHYAEKSQRTPKWLTDEQLDQMIAIYKEARQQSLEVDHVYPLKGKTVSGLHVPWNLQLLTPEENRRKSNKVIYAS